MSDDICPRCKQPETSECPAGECVPAKPVIVHVITFREKLDKEVVAHISSSLEKAVEWIKGQKPSDWEGGWWAVGPEQIDAPDNVCPETVTLYDLNGNKIDSPPETAR